LYQRIDHVGIAVRDLKFALRLYESALGFSAERFEEVQSQKVRVAVLPVGESRIELLQATEDDSPIARFIAKRGEGFHHICFQVEDIAAELAKLKAAGIKLIDEHPRSGADKRLVAFVHPSSTGGLLIELSQIPGPDEH
jgi:methylmalonyl-CoA/ethylmalonyl-CoA epimerase